MQIQVETVYSLPVLTAMADVGSAAFVAPNATLAGDVVLAAGSSVWYGAVVRGDTGADVYKRQLFCRTALGGRRAVIHGLAEAFALSFLLPSTLCLQYNR